MGTEYATCDTPNNINIVVIYAHLLTFGDIFRGFSSIPDHHHFYRFLPVYTGFNGHAGAPGDTTAAALFPCK